ncbi:MAG: 4-hydroxybutyrate--acetyl-CoA CoA transferase [Oscillibacter sp.]|nr:4-hydroxybutyrate--acetyl-CoA CoA transferase [Oscillibacter sp.]
MVDYQALYNEKRMSVEEAAALIPSGAVCASDTALAHTESFYQALANRVLRGEVKDITHHSILEFGDRPFFTKEVSEEYHAISWFSGVSARKGINQGYGDVMPAYFRDFPRLFREFSKPEILIAAVAPMDKHGYFSVGCVGGATPALLDTAKTVLLEVNRHMPRSLASPQIHISQVAALWEDDHPLRTSTPVKIDEVSARIGELITDEIPNGATLQLGVGAIPEAVGMALKSKRNLGIHTELFTDSMMALIDCGAVDNSLKPIHRGKTVATFAFGSQRMYDYIDDNPMMEILPVDYVNDPAVIAQHPNFISINAALEVDFFGQVCAESLGTYHISGTGGQSDYVRGAVQSKGGKSFIAFTSTANGGQSSRITSTLTPGAVVSTSKNDVDYIVTEYGIAHLRGASLSQRTKALISIAHPKFREELTFQAKKRNIII